MGRYEDNGVFTMSSLSGLFNSLNATRYKSLLHPSEAAGTFASDIVRRAKTPGVDADSAAEPDVDAKEKLKQAKQLESALSGTVNYVTDAFGEKAGTTMMALVYKRIGDGEVTEESLGNAFLDVTRFIDKNFGIDKGDAFIDHLNGTLNDSLNAYFDNGATEQFIAVTTPVSSLSASVKNDVVANAGKQAAESILALIEAMRAGKGADQNAPYAEQQTQYTGLLMDALV